jgi:Spy/CpxP family protein refolding chaperone
MESGPAGTHRREESMRVKIIFSLFFAASLLIFAGRGEAQTPEGNEAAQSAPAENQNPDFDAQKAWPMGPATRVRVVDAGPMVRSQVLEEHGANFAAPLQIFSRMEAELDNPMVRTALGLTDQQADSLRKIVVDTEIYTIQTGAGVVVDGIQLKELLRADRPDRAAVMAKGDEISKAGSELVHHYLDAVLSAKTILTPEQQKIIREYMEKRATGMGFSGGRVMMERQRARP